MNKLKTPKELALEYAKTWNDSLGWTSKEIAEEAYHMGYTARDEEVKKLKDENARVYMELYGALKCLGLL
jgi:hypothetical protein